MPLLRLMEPTFFQIVKEMAADRFTCKKKNTSDGSVVSSSLLEQAKKKEMTPMFFFLSSSLNVQLVYTILKGVTQFSYVDFSRFDEDSEIVHSNKKMIKFTRDSKTHDLTVTLDYIKIKDQKSWETSEAADLKQDDLIVPRSNAMSFISNLGNDLESITKTKSAEEEQVEEPDVVKIS